MRKLLLISLAIVILICSCATGTDITKKNADGTYASAWSAGDLGKRFDVVFTPTGTQGMPVDSTWTEAEFEWNGETVHTKEMILFREEFEENGGFRS